MSTEKSDPHNDTDHQPKNWLDKIMFKLGDAASVFFLFTVVITFYEIVMRYVFNAPTIWVHETATFIGGVLFVLGGSYALATNRHVRVVLLYDSVSKRTQKLLNIFHHIMGLIFTASLIYASYFMADGAFYTPWGEPRLETSGSAWDPAYPAYTKLIILIVFIIMFFQFLLHLIQELVGIRGRK
jgi:TRAP-type mannitol/chloroaromatic compound transport system permease small subunit